MSFIKISKIFLAISAVLVLASLFLLFIKPGPRFSIEFTGGTLMEVVLPQDKTKADLEAALQKYKPLTEEGLGNITVTIVKGETAAASQLIRMRPISNEEHVSLLAALSKEFPGTQELKFNTIGPSVSASLKERTIVALIVASLAIISYLAFAFRTLPRQLNPWKFGFLAIVGCLHDIIVALGLFVIISQFTSFEFDTLFVTALLSVMGYSVSDKIVIFDRIRDTIKESKGRDFAQVAGDSLKKSLSRTLNTGFGALIMLSSLFFLGSESIRWFILALIFGIILGTYSSYFVAAPLLVFWTKANKK